MARFSVNRSARRHEKALFLAGEIAATCAFLVLTLAIICAPYLLGLFPEIDAEFMRGVR